MVAGRNRRESLVILEREVRREVAEELAEPMRWRWVRV